MIYHMKSRYQTHGVEDRRKDMLSIPAHHPHALYRSYPSRETSDLQKCITHRLTTTPTTAFWISILLEVSIQKRFHSHGQPGSAGLWYPLDGGKKAGALLFQEKSNSKSLVKWIGRAIEQKETSIAYAIYLQFLASSPIAHPT